MMQSGLYNHPDTRPHGHMDMHLAKRLLINQGHKAASMNNVLGHTAIYKTGSRCIKFYFLVAYLLGFRIK